MIVAFFLVSLNLSIMLVTPNSSIEIDDVNAPMNNNAKNKNPKIYPNAIVENIAGRVTNASSGPVAGLKPKENTIGKIINPANIAINVSAPAIHKDDFIKFSFLLV